MVLSVSHLVAFIRVLVTYQIIPLGFFGTNLATKNFFELLEPEKVQGGGLEMISEKSFFTHMARFAQGMQNVILHMYFIYLSLSIFQVKLTAHVFDF